MYANNYKDPESIMELDPLKSDTISSQHFIFEERGCEIKFPYYSNLPIYTPNHSIERVIVVIHGVLRNANEYLANTIEAAQRYGAEERTLIVAPQFLACEDNMSVNLPSCIPYWGGITADGWKCGDNSLSDTAPVSSFTVLDRLIQTLANLDLFPALSHIVIVGHSAGGQCVNRYAAGTRVNNLLPQEVKLRFIVANPSTYLYFSADRMTADKKIFAVPELEESEFNLYKYGLKELNPYLSCVGADMISEQYCKRQVAYLLGGEDIEEEFLDKSPAANWQGRNRLERGQVYFHYLRFFFGPWIEQKHSIAIVPCIGHDHAAIFASQIGAAYLFGD